MRAQAVAEGPTRRIGGDVLPGGPYHRVDRRDARRWVFDHPFHLVVDLAVGGTLGGAPGPGDDQPQQLIVDHVRVYAPA